MKDKVNFQNILFSNINTEWNSEFLKLFRFKLKFQLYFFSLNLQRLKIWFRYSNVFMYFDFLEVFWLLIVANQQRSTLL